MLSNESSLARINFALSNLLHTKQSYGQDAQIKQIFNDVKRIVYLTRTA